MCNKISYIFIIIILCSTTVILSPYRSEGTQLELAGKALFPVKEHHEWLSIQLNPNLAASTKIESTVNTYFILKYESWKRLMLFDFGFLFDKIGSEAWYDYAYERGLLNLYLVSWKYRNLYLRTYEYNPEFHLIDINGEEAEVVISPKARIGIRDDHISNTPWGMHTVKLVCQDDKWLIERLINEDFYLEMYPPGSDFKELAATSLDRIKKNNELQGIYRNIKEELAKKIVGVYKSDKKDLVFKIYYSKKDKQLLCSKDNNDEQIKLYPHKDNDLEFLMIPQNGQFYDFKFIEDSSGKIAKCLIKTMGQKYTVIKTSDKKTMRKTTFNSQ